MAKLYIFCGIPFSGKSVLSTELAKRLRYARIDLDEVKTDLFGKDVKDTEIEKSRWDSVYEEMYRRIDTALSNGETVIHDTGNFTKHERRLVREIGDKLGIHSITVFVDTPVTIARERWLTNRKTHERFDVADEDFESSITEMEPPDETEPHIIYAYGQDVSEWIQTHFSDKIDNELVRPG